MTKVVVEFGPKRCKYNQEAFLASAGDTKALYKKVNRLTGETTQSLPTHKDPKKLAEDFKVFFSEKVNNIRSSIKEESLGAGSGPDNVSEDFVGTHFEKFRPITGDELIKYIDQISSKFCCPTFLRKKC